MVKLICKNHCLDQIRAIEEMLSTSKEDIQLKIHFGDQDYADKVIPFLIFILIVERKQDFILQKVMLIV